MREQLSGWISYGIRVYEAGHRVGMDTTLVRMRASRGLAPWELVMVSDHATRPAVELLGQEKAPDETEQPVSVGGTGMSL
jgi:hypothetical protein